MWVEMHFLSNMQFKVEILPGGYELLSPARFQLLDRSDEARLDCYGEKSKATAGTAEIEE
jgi:hypothetical protein